MTDIPAAKQKPKGTEIAAVCLSCVAILISLGAIGLNWRSTSAAEKSSEAASKSAEASELSAKTNVAALDFQKSRLDTTLRLTVSCSYSLTPDAVGKEIPEPILCLNIVNLGKKVNIRDIYFQTDKGLGTHKKPITFGMPKEDGELITLDTGEAYCLEVSPSQFSALSPSTYGNVVSWVVDVLGSPKKFEAPFEEADKAFFSAPVQNGLDVLEKEEGGRLIIRLPERVKKK